jgi:hypothetical protein
MTNSTYLAMCSDPRIQEKLKWEPKVGEVFLNSYRRLRYIKYYDPESREVIDTDGDPYLRKWLIWLPRTDDLVERLKQFDDLAMYKIQDGWLVDRNESFYSHMFEGETLQESLLLAFAWTVGLKWGDNQWKERR